MMGGGCWTALILGSWRLSYRRHGSFEWVLVQKVCRLVAGSWRESAGHLQDGIATGLGVVAPAVVAVYCGDRLGHPQSGTKSSPVAIDSLPVGYT